MLVLDEVQCGYARTGKMFAHEHYGITPDIMAAAKAIGGGFPMGACLATEKAAAGMVIGTHGSTYGGNPLACAAGQAVLDIVANDEFLERVTRMGERLRGALEQMIPNHDHLFEGVRGMGLLLGIKMKSDSRAFVEYLREQGLLTVAAGDNVDARAAAPDRRGGAHRRVRRAPVRGRPPLRGAAGGLAASFAAHLVAADALAQMRVVGLAQLRRLPRRRGRGGRRSGGPGDRGRFVQQRAGEDDRAAGRGAVGARRHIRGSAGRRPR